jgi:uncharacterized protein (DUF2147 family)
MRINAKALQVATFAAALLTMSAARADNSPLGLWIDHTGRGAVEIKECNGNKLCGNIVWLKDTKNNEACGEQVLGDVKPMGGNKWDSGWIYDPDSESKYDVELTALGDKLRVVGYAGSKWLSETMTWTRAPSDLQRCAKNAAAATPAANAKATTVAAAPAAAQPEKQAEAKSAPADSKQAAATPPAPTASASAASQPADTPTKEARAESELKPSGDAAAKDDEKKDEGASANAQNDKDADDNGADAKGAPKQKGEVLKKVTEALNLKKLKNGKCKMDVPFMDMQVTFDCDQ